MILRLVIGIGPYWLLLSVSMLSYVICNIICFFMNGNPLSRILYCILYVSDNTYMYMVMILRLVIGIGPYWMLLSVSMLSDVICNM